MFRDLSETVCPQNQLKDIMMLIKQNMCVYKIYYMILNLDEMLAYLCHLLECACAIENYLGHQQHHHDRHPYSDLILERTKKIKTM